MFQNGLLQDQKPFVYLKRVEIHASRSSWRLIGLGSVELVDGDDLHNVHNSEAMQLLSVLHYSHKSSASNAVP